MPIYEYRCAQCGHQQESLQKVSDAPLTLCPKCHQPKLAKMVTAAGFQLKGSGWYATDFKNKSTSSPAKPDAGKSDGGGGDAKGGDAKGGESKGGESKGGESRGGESKGGESKGETKAGATGCGGGCACH